MSADTEQNSVSKIAQPAEKNKREKIAGTNLLRGGPGRKKGVPNKLTSDLRQIILLALDRRGGVEYLLTLSDTDFTRLLARVIPQEVDAKLSGNVTVIINSDGDGKK